MSSENACRYKNLKMNDLEDESSVLLVNETTTDFPVENIF